MSRKTLINEVLPKPTEASGASLRDRVLRHADKVLKAGALTGGAALSGCLPGSGLADAGFIAVDPLPPPCSRSDPALSAVATAVAATQGDVTVTVRASSNFQWEISQTATIHTVVGATLNAPPQTASHGGILTIEGLFRPDADTATFSYQVDFRCDSPATTTTTLLITVTMPSTDGGLDDAGPPQATVTVVTTDGGQ